MGKRMVFSNPVEVNVRAALHLYTYSSYALRLSLLSLIRQNHLGSLWDSKLTVMHPSLLISYLPMTLFLARLLLRISLKFGISLMFTPLGQGQRCNFEKSPIYFSWNITLDKQLEFANLLHVKMVDISEKYLGGPLFKGRSSMKDFNFIVEKLNSKLSSWKRNMLSFAGRKVLIKSVIVAIPTYFMSTNLLPTGILLNIERKMRDFFWGFHTPGRHLSQNLGCSKTPKITRRYGLS